MGKQSFVEKLTGTSSGGIITSSRATLNTPASNVGRMYSPIAGTLTGLDIYAPNGTISGDWTFNFFVNGVAQFSGGTRLTVNEGSRHATKTGLSIAIAKDDLVTFDLQVAGPSPLFGPVQFTMIIDDGVGLALVAGAGISIDDTDPENPIISTTGVDAIVAGSGISIDDTDPHNPIISSLGGSSNSWDETIVKPADETRTATTTYAADSDLQFAVDANSVYAFEAVLWLSCNNAAVSGKFRHNCTQTPQSGLFGIEYLSAFVSLPSTSTPNLSRLENTTTGSDRVVAAGGFYSLMKVNGRFKTHATNAGIFSIEWAQNVSNANNLIVNEGSCISYKKA